MQITASGCWQDQTSFGRGKVSEEARWWSPPGAKREIQDIWGAYDVLQELHAWQHVFKNPCRVLATRQEWGDWCRSGGWWMICFLIPPHREIAICFFFCKTAEAVFPLSDFGHCVLWIDNHPHECLNEKKKIFIYKCKRPLVLTAFWSHYHAVFSRICTNSTWRVEASHMKAQRRLCPL